MTKPKKHLLHLISIFNGLHYYYRLQKSMYVSWAARVNKDLRVATLYGVNYPERATQLTGAVIYQKNSIKLKAGDGVINRPIFAVSDDDAW